MKKPDSLDSKKAQLIIYLCIKMLDRQNDQDLKELNNVIYHHKIICEIEDCICRDQYQILVSNFKYASKELLMKRKFYHLNQLEKQSQEDYDEMRKRKFESVGFNSIDQTIDPVDITIEPADNTINNLEINHLAMNEQINTTKNANQRDNDKIQIQANCTFAQSFTLDNKIVLDLKMQDLFKDVFEIENFNIKQFQSQNPQNQNIMELNVENEDNKFKPWQNKKFDNIKAARKYIFIRLLEQILKTIEQAQSTSFSVRNLDFQLQYINFINQHFQKHFLAIFQLLKINQRRRKLGFIDRLYFNTCEQLILDQALKKFTNEQGSGYDYSYFINGNHQQLELDSYYDQATFDIIGFWKRLKSDSPKINELFDLGIEIAQNVKRIKTMTRILEQNQILRKDLGKYQIYALFHLEMLHDPVSSSQMANYMRNAMVYKNKNKIYGQAGMESSQLLNQQMNDAGIAIVQAWGGQRQQWEFIYGNKMFCDILNIKESQLPNKNINNIMPIILANNHDSIIKKFYQEGKQKILNKLRVQFAKDFQGYLLPISLRINFYYHLKFSYSFIVQMEKPKYMNLYLDDQNKINTDDCMIVITDNELNILEFSKNFLINTGLTREKLIQYQEMNGKNMNLQIIITELHSILSKEFGISLIPSRSNQSLVNKYVTMNKFNESLDQFEEIQSYYCFLTYLQDSFITQSEEVKMNIFLIIPVAKHPEYEIQSLQHSIMNVLNQQISSSKGQSLRRKSGFLEVNERSQNIQDNTFDSEEFKQSTELLEISSMSSNSSSSGNSVMQAHYSKNLLFLNRAPKVLKINTFIFVGMIVAFIVISSYNLGVFIDKHAQIQGRQKTLAYISQRNSNVRASLLSLKMIHSIVQDVENLNKSSVLPSDFSRLDYYQKELKNSLEIVRTQADQFNQFIMMNKDYFDFSLQFDDLQFLTDIGWIYTQTVSFKHSVKLLISYSDAITLQQFLNEKPPLNVSNYAKNYSILNQSVNEIGDRKLTNLEQSLYYIFTNGMYKLAELGLRQVLMLQEACFAQAELSLITLSVTTFVSIGIVSLIGIVVFPLLTRVLERQYNILRFFSNLEPKIIDNCIKKGTQFRKSLLVKIGDDSRDKKEHSKRMSNNQMGDAGQQINLDQNPQLNSTRKIQTPNGITIHTKDTNSKRALQQEANIQYNRKKKMNKALRKQQKQLLFQKQIQKTKDGKQIADTSKDYILRKSKDLYKIDEVEQEKYERSEEENHEENNSNKERIASDQVMSKQKLIQYQLQKLSLSQRLKVFGFLVLFVAYLNISLIISYYQSNQVFNNDKDSLIQLRKVYDREDCAYNLILLMREKIIRNFAVPIRIYYNSTDYQMEKAVYYYTDRCFELENQIASLRKSIPEYLSKAEEDFNKYESNEMCNLTYGDVSNEKVVECQNSLDKLLLQGMGNAMYYLTGYIQQTNLNFDSVQARTKQFQTTLLNQNKMHDLADFQLYFMKAGFDSLQSLISNTSIQYFDQAKVNYLLAFGLFLTFTVILSFILGIVLYIKIKQRLLDIQNMLVLIPLDELQQNQRLKIENYLSK